MPSRPATTVLLLAILAACVGEGEPEPGASEARDGRALSGELLVSAAASLTDAFEDVASAFEARHPGVDVALNLGGSGALATQILEGAPVDVFASANPATMARVAEAGEVSGVPSVFAANRLRIAVPAGNPAGVAGPGDFADEALRLGLCAEGVPCGDLAREALARAGVVPALDTNEPDVRALLGKIELGELDAGITWATDVASAGGAVEGIDLPVEIDAVAELPVAVLAGAPNRAAAEAFARFLLSGDAMRILERHGFLPP